MRKTVARWLVFTLMAASEAGAEMMPDAQCAIEGPLPKGIAMDREAICRLFLAAAPADTTRLLIRFGRRSTVSVDIAAGSGPTVRRYPAIGLSEMDRPIGVESLRALANAIAVQTGRP